MTNSVSINFDGLNKLRDAIGKGTFVKVGILGSDNARENEEGSDLTNAELGVIQEFGSLTNNIPPRSFLKMPLEQPEMKAFVGGAKIGKLIEEANFEGAMNLIGLKGEEMVDKAFRSGGFGKWQANAPETVRRKGSSKPLVDTGQLRRAITSEVENAKET